MLHSKFLTAVAVVALAISGCSKSGDASNPIGPVQPTDTTSAPLTISTSATETFESGTKTDYAGATVSLITGKWSIDNGVIGTTAEDKKNGLKSLRIREAGKITMNFDIANAVYRVAVSSAVYNTDGASTWQLYASYNSGATYAPVGNVITTAGTSLQHDTIVIASIKKVRFSLHKLSGGSNQLNIDDISFLLSAPPPAPTFADDDNMLLGNPSTATPSILNFNNYFMDKGFYAMSYNRDAGKPNWVSWHLKAADFGSTARQNDFRPDPDLPSAWYAVSDASYTGAGFDRGHSCPSDERTASIPANSSTFLMSNIIPQAANNNQGPWAKLEDSCKLLIQAGKELFIVCGSFGVGGTGNNGLVNTIDNGHVTVPQYVWKVVVVLPDASNDYNRMNAGMRVITVMLPNSNTINPNWKTYRTSINNLELMAGGSLNLLSNLPSGIQTAVKAAIDNL